MEPVSESMASNIPALGMGMMEGMVVVDVVTVVMVDVADDLIRVGREVAGAAAGMSS